MIRLTGLLTFTYTSFSNFGVFHTLIDSFFAANFCTLCQSATTFWASQKYAVVRAVKASEAPSDVQVPSKTLHHSASAGEQQSLAMISQIFLQSFHTNPSQRRSYALRVHSGTCSVCSTASVCLVQTTLSTLCDQKVCQPTGGSG